MAAGEQCDQNKAPHAVCAQCQWTCDSGFGDCNADMTSDGCEADLTDIANCGECGNVCDGFPECGAGGCARYVFTSSQLYSGDMGGIAGANVLCDSLAADAGLTGSYRAWLSADVGGSPAQNFTRTGGRWVLVDGTYVAEDWADLTDGLLGWNIELTEFGTEPPPAYNFCNANQVWSNTTPEGTMYDSTYDCTNWTIDNTNPSAWGRWDRSSTEWTQACFGGNQGGCDEQAPIMCFEQ